MPHLQPRAQEALFRGRLRFCPAPKGPTIVMTQSPLLTPSETEKVIRKLAAQRILVLDGAMGTALQRYHLGESDYRADRFDGHGRELKGNNDLLALTRPHIVSEIHRAYLAAGSDIISTNTFSG